MTVLNIALNNLIHPPQRFGDTSILHDNVAVMVPPAEIIRTMIESAYAQLLYMK